MVFDGILTQQTGFVLFVVCEVSAWQLTEIILEDSCDLIEKYLQSLIRFEHNEHC